MLEPSHWAVLPLVAGLAQEVKGAHDRLSPTSRFLFAAGASLGGGLAVWLIVATAGLVWDINQEIARSRQRDTHLTNHINQLRRTIRRNERLGERNRRLIQTYVQKSLAEGSAPHRKEDAP